MADGSPVAPSPIGASDTAVVPAAPTPQLTTFDIIIPLPAIIGAVGVLLLVITLVIKRRRGKSP